MTHHIDGECSGYDQIVWMRRMSWDETVCMILNAFLSRYMSHLYVILSTYNWTSGNIDHRRHSHNNVSHYNALT